MHSVTQQEETEMKKGKVMKTYDRDQVKQMLTMAIGMSQQCASAIIEQMAAILGYSIEEFQDVVNQASIHPDLANRFAPPTEKELAQAADNAEFILEKEDSK